MKKNQSFIISSLFIVMVAIFACLSTGKGAVASDGAPQENILIDGKKPVNFSHTAHTALGMDCQICHHDNTHSPLTAEQVAAIPPENLQCGTCHNADFQTAKLQNAKDVFHGRCQTCHKQGYNGTFGPTKCTECHIRKNRQTLEGC